MDSTEQYYKKMTQTPVAKLIVTLGIPTTISMLITNIYNMADTYFVGTLGESPQGATSVLFTLQAIIQAIAFMLGQGSGTMVSKSLADKDVDEASKYVSSAFFIGGTLGLLLTIFGLIFIEPFMLLLGSSDTILPYAKDYGMWILLACPFMICSLVLNNNLRYEGKAFYSMIGLVTGGILNIFGDYVLIRIYDMGVYGAGLATASSQLVSFCILLFFHTKMAQGNIRFCYIAKKISYYLTIFKVGFPAMVRQGLTSISHGLLNNLTKPFGDAAMAAMGIVNRYSSLLMCVGLGIGQGFQPVASYNYQARAYKRVKKGLKVTMGLGAVVITLISLPGFIFAEDVVRLFQKSPDVIEIGAYALRWASIGVLFMPLSVPVNMLYQSIRRPDVSTILSMLRSGLAMIPTLLITCYFLGLTGIQISQPIADIVTGLVSIPFIIIFFNKKFDNDIESTQGDNKC